MASWRLSALSAAQSGLVVGEVGRGLERRGRALLGSSVAVLGGGPLGAETVRRLALAGARVTLYETTGKRALLARVTALRERLPVEVVPLAAIPGELRLADYLTFRGHDAVINAAGKAFEVAELAGHGVVLATPPALPDPRRPLTRQDVDRSLAQELRVRYPNFFPELR